MVARVQVKLMKPREKVAVMKSYSAVCMHVIQNLLFSSKNKSTGSDAEKGGNVFEDISDILLRQVIRS